MPALLTKPIINTLAPLLVTLPVPQTGPPPGNEASLLPAHPVFVFLGTGNLKRNKPKRVLLRSTAERPIVPGRRAVLKNGLAYAPSEAPSKVKRLIWAANQIRNRPYSYGGGHGSFQAAGYDCSGSVSYALHGAGLTDSPMDSSGLMSWGQNGKGRWLTVYSNPGHVYLTVAGLRFDTSGARPNRWQKRLEGWGSGYTVRTIKGL